jgi:NTE family protein
VIIAVNLNGELLGRRFTEPEPPEATRPSCISGEVLRRTLAPLPKALRRSRQLQVPPAGTDAPRADAAAPGYFDVLATAINIMQDHITRTRLAGEPPHVMLVPRLRAIGLMEFNRADEAIEEGRACVEHALPALRRYLS